MTTIATTYRPAVTSIRAIEGGAIVASPLVLTGRAVNAIEELLEVLVVLILISLIITG